MACFTVPLATAAVTTATKLSLPESTKGNSFVAKLPWLEKMMFGGSLILALEHIYHGEVIFRPPFLTAMTEGPEAISEMLHEMATRGVAMTLLVIAVWVGMVTMSRAKPWSFARFKGTMALVALGAALMFAVDLLADVI
jgi:hypothetical protein